MNINKAVSRVSNCVRYEVFGVWFKNTKSFSFWTDDKCLLSCPSSKYMGSSRHMLYRLRWLSRLRRGFHGAHNQWNMLGVSAALWLCRSHWDKLAVHDTHRDNGEATGLQNVGLRHSGDAADISRTFYWIYYLYLLSKFSSYFFSNPLIVLGVHQTS